MAAKGDGGGRVGGGGRKYNVDHNNTYQTGPTMLKRDMVTTVSCFTQLIKYLKYKT